MLLLLIGCPDPAVPVVGEADTGEGTAPTYGLDARPDNPTCTAPQRPAVGGQAAWSVPYPSVNLTSVVQMRWHDGRWFFIRQSGQIFSLSAEAGADDLRLVLDISDAVEVNFESGLLDAAFHPAEDGVVFLSYSLPVGSGQRSVISRFVSTDGFSTIDPSSGEEILSVDQPAANHNGGQLGFGPDGYLYASLGDGGGAGDVFDNGQDTTTLHGSILRIDVDGGAPYAIPADNPFADGGGAEEIYAYGLRNPWRFVFDRATGALWAGDVGQSEREEIDRIERGGNYGWPIREGTLCYEAASCETAGLTEPVLDYWRGQGASVIMGPVYRGEVLAGLVGAPLYSDFYEGAVSAILTDTVSGAPYGEEIAGAVGEAYAFFAEDDDGEIFTVGYYSGVIRRLEPAEDTGPSTFPERLSETGCVDMADASQPAEGLIPYTVLHPLWSDGADKERWLAVPDGEVITLHGDQLVLPAGSVVVKHFSLAGERIETRLMVRHDDGYWAGYSYAWQGSDAVYVSGGMSEEISGQTWSFPSSGDCLRCHTEAAGRTLGLTTAQLAGEHTYPTGRTADQLDTLRHIGLLSGEVGALWPLAGRDAETEEAARAYLEVNCANCHQPDGPGGGSMDLRSETALAAMGICDVSPEQGDLGIADARLLAPGAPERSLIAVRMALTDIHRMPPLGSSVVDAEGLDIIEDWIAGLSACP